MNPPKSGLKTTEFWSMVLTLILVTLVSTGVLTTQQVQELESPLSRILTSLAAIAADVVLVYRYLNIRHEAKVLIPFNMAMEQKATEQ